MPAANRIDTLPKGLPIGADPLGENRPAPLQADTLVPLVLVPLDVSLERQGHIGFQSFDFQEWSKEFQEARGLSAVGFPEAGAWSRVETTIANRAQCPPHHATVGIGQRDGEVI